MILLNYALSLQKQHEDGSALSTHLESLSITLTADLPITEDVIQSCKELISSHFFSIEGLPTVTASHKDDHEGHLILRCATIVVHTAMAVLLRTLSQALSVVQAFPGDDDQVLSTVYRRRCRKSLKEAINITRGLADSDFPFIDVAMAVGFPLLTCSPCMYIADRTPSRSCRYVGSRS